MHDRSCAAGQVNTAAGRLAAVFGMAWQNVMGRSLA